jgi:hypothetical protein
MAFRITDEQELVDWFNHQWMQLSPCSQYTSARIRRVGYEFDVEFRHVNGVGRTFVRLDDELPRPPGIGEYGVEQERAYFARLEKAIARPQAAGERQ